MDPNDVSYLGETTYHRRHQRFGIRQQDRLSHLYVIGKTGVGKSTLLKQLVRQDMAAGRGFALIDPHGDLATELWAEADDATRERTTYLNAPDPTQSYGYNPLRRVRDDLIPLSAAGILETLRKLWPSAWGVRMEHILRHSLLALLEQEQATLADILRLYDDKAFRERIARSLRNPIVREFWQIEYKNYPARLRAEAIAPIQNKLGALLADPTLYRILAEPVADIRFRSMMDEGRGLIVNLSRGQLGEDAARILGGLLVTTIGLAAFSRAESSDNVRRPFFLHVDEFQNFTTLAFANMMAELRKYGVGLTLAHQHIHQLEPDILHAVFGNAGSLIAFRIGAEDAPVIAAELQPTFGTLDLINLPNRHFYLKLMIDGAPSAQFSARTLSIVKASQPKAAEEALHSHDEPPFRSKC